MSLFGRGKDEPDKPSSAAPAERPRPSPPAGATARPTAPGTTSRPTAPAAGARTGGNDVTHVGRSVVLKGDLSGDEDLTITLEARADPYSYSPRRILATGSTAVVRVCS